MPTQKPQRPQQRARVIAPVADDFVQRQLADASQRAADQLHDRNGVFVSLIVGANTITHGLGRKPRGVAVTPTVADASWAYALTRADAKQATVTCVGVAQPNAYVEFS
jgi:hypothetical protein